MPTSLRFVAQHLPGRGEPWEEGLDAPLRSATSARRSAKSRSPVSRRLAAEAVLASVI